MKRLILATLLAATASAGLACTPIVEPARLVADWVARTPIRGLEGEFSLADAECTRDRFQEALQAQAGAVVGYKAGLTNPGVQKMLGYDAPIRGVLLASMLLPDGATVPLPFGTRPLMEADLLVEVGDEAINAATTPAEVMAHLTQIIPFIELPDLLIDPQVRINGLRLLALNVGARLGVRGVGVPASPALLEALGTMSVSLADQNGKVLAQGKGSDILGHPLNAVIWLARDLASHGQRLKKGDLLSLGSFNPPIPPQAGQEITVSYSALPSVTVRFK